MLETPLIIGIVGKKQSGKTTAAHAILNLQPDALLLPFAMPLKTIVRATLVPSDWDLTLEDMDKEEVKTAMLPCGITLRQALQKVGTDWFRQLDPDVWLNTWYKQLVCVPRSSVVVVPDVRFPNEAKLIQDLGGTLIKLTRAPFATADQHASELGIDQITLTGFPGMYVIYNRDMTIPEQNDAVQDIVLPLIQEHHDAATHTKD